MKRMLIALGAAAAGAVVLSLLDEYARPKSGRASPLERLSEQALARSYAVFGAHAPRTRVLRARAHLLGWLLAGGATGAAAILLLPRRGRVLYPPEIETAGA